MKIVARCSAITALAVLVTAQWSVAASPAKEGNADGLDCYTGPVQVNAGVKNHVGMSYDIIGTLIRKEGELGYLSSSRCVGSAMVNGKESNDAGTCVMTDPDGDRIFFTYSGRNGQGGPWNAVGGTGKYEGIEASGTWVNAIRPVKPVRADMIQVCNRNVGSWKLR